MRLWKVLLLSMVVFPSISHAETAFVTDNLFITIREGQGNETPAVKSIATGTELEVLQRLGGFALVREAGGAEGWIALRYLVDTAPGKVQLEAARSELRLANSELSTLKGKLDESGKKTQEANARVKALEKQLKPVDVAGESGANPASNNPEDAAETTNSPDQRASGLSGFYFSWAWLLFAFAMLVTGFIAGVTWLRELNRRKMGGMYLRI